MKSRKSEADLSSRRKVGTIGGILRPTLVVLKQGLVTMPGINRLVRGGRKPVTHLYPYQKVELPTAYRGQHSIDWFKCIGCELCAKVCPNECIYFEFYEAGPNDPYLHPSRAMLDEMKKVIRRPAVDVGHCLFCGNCMEYCPTDAWNFSQEFELADYAREDLYYRAEELRRPEAMSDKEIVLENRMGEHPILEADICIGCRKCERECPTRCIDMLDEMKKIVRRPAVDIGHCLFCGNCMEYCPTDAWNFTQEFELADYAREDLYYRADELRMPKENSDKEIVLINRIGEHPILEVDVCIGCRKCERECPTRCIDMLDGPNDRKGKPIVIPEFDYAKCIGCQQCVDVCPVDCLHMEEIGHKDMQDFYHISLQGEVKLLEEQVEK